jgi:dTMP kinase
MKKGLFITFEGIDGCGKSTQLANAAKNLLQLGYRVITTREPGGTPIAEKIREILTDPDHDEMVNECELLLYCAARAQHVREKIIPAVENGTVVLCDRFQEATFAYQGFGRSINMDHLTMLNSYATGGIQPDLTFIIDITVEKSFSRLEKMNKSKDRLEMNGKEFFTKIRNGYLELALKNPKRVVVIDGDRDIEIIEKQVLEIIEQSYKN